MSVSDAVRVQLSAVGGPETLAQLLGVRTAMQALNGQKVTVASDVTGLRTITTEAQAAQATVKVLNAQQISPRVDVGQITGARTAMQGLQSDATSAAAAMSKLAAPVAIGAAVAGVTALAAGYQTLLTVTQNNTTMAAADIKTLDQTIRALPSAGASLDSVASGIKNITDLGYSMADAQKIATVESKAATETSSNQATVMLAATSAMKEYNATQAQAGVYTNTIAEASKLGNSTMGVWTEGTRRVTAVAANLGVPLQEVDAAMVALTRHGFDASQASTFTAALLQHIIAPSQSAQKEIAKLAQTTGVDLSQDFSLSGLRAKGLAAVLDDLSRATRGNEEEIYKLIPATRGGQAALVLAGQGAVDFQSALTDLSKTMDGSLTPVEDGFARIQQTAGYQWGAFTKQLKFDAIDAGNAFLPLATNITTVLSAVPAPALQAGTDLALLFGTMKGGAAIGDLVATGAAKLNTAFLDMASANAVAAEAQARTIAMEEAGVETTAADTAAIEALTAAKRELGVTSLSIDSEVMASAQAAEARMAQRTAAAEADAAATAEAETAFSSRGALLGGGLAAVGAGLASMVAPVAITLVAASIIEKPLNDALEQYLLDHNKDLKTLDMKVNLALDPNSGATDITRASDLSGTKAALERQIQAIYDQAQQAAADFRPQGNSPSDILSRILQIGMDTSGKPDTQGQQLIDAYKAEIKRIDDAVAQDTPQAKAAVQAQAEALLSAQQNTITAEFQRGQVTVEEAKREFTLAALQDLPVGADPTQFKSDIDARVAIFTRGINQMQDLQDQESQMGRDRAANLQMLGASPALITADAAGDKAATKEATALIKQDADAAKELKANLAEVAAGYTVVAKAVGSIDTAKGIPDLVKQLGQLKTAQADLTVMGQDNTGLDGLVAMGEQFSELAIREREASREYDSFLASTAHTDTYVKELDNFKTHLSDLQKYVQDKPKGYVTDADVTYLSHYNTMLAEANNQESALKETEVQRANSLYNSGQFPDFAKMNADYQALIDTFGGGPAVQLKFELDTTEALKSTKSVETAMNAVAQDPHHVVMLLEGANHKDVAADIAAAGGDISKLSAHDWQVILDVLVGDKTGMDALTALNDAQAARHQVLVDVIYSNPATKQELLTTTDYQDVAHRVQTQVAHASDQTVAVGVEADVAAFDNTMQVERENNAKLDILVDATTTAAQAAIDALKNQDIVINVTPNVSAPNYGYPDGTPSGPQAPYGPPLPQRGVPGGSYTGPFADEGPHAAGGYVRGGAIVGDSRSGDMSNAEYVVGNFRVFSHVDSMRMGKINAGTPRYAGGTPDTVAFGDTKGPYDGSNPGPTADLSKPIKNATGAAHNLNSTLAVTNSTLINIGSSANVFAGILGNLNTTGLKEVSSQLGNQLSINKQIAEQALGPKATPEQKAAADQGVEQATVDQTIAFARAVQDAQDPANNLADDFQRIRDSGAANADNLIRQVSIMREIGVATAQIATDQQKITDDEAQHTATVAARQAIDTQASRQKTLDSWKEQNQQTQANAAWTTEQRKMQDATRSLDFGLSLQSRQLSDSLTNLQTQQQNQVWQRTSAEQLVGAQAKGAGTNASAAILAGQLAGMHDQDLAQKDLNTVAIDGLKQQIQLQTTSADQQRYDLETTQLQETRDHEDAMARLAQTKQNQTITDTLHQWALEDQRAREDALYNQTKATDDAKLKADQARKTALDSQLTDTQAIEALWEKVYAFAGPSANALLGVLPQLATTATQTVAAATYAANYGASVQGLTTANGVPYSQFSAPGQYAAGGTFSGMGIVGDSASGDMSNAEVVMGSNVTVLSHAQASRMGLLNPRTARYAGGTTSLTSTDGGTTNLHLHFNGGTALSDADIADIKRYVDTKVAANSQAGRMQKRALGLTG